MAGGEKMSSGGLISAARLYPVLAIDGLNGSGKTLVGACLAQKEDRVLSNARLEGAQVMRRWQDFFAFVAKDEPGFILLDEVQSVAGARDFGSLPTEALTLLCQLRKHEITCAYTSPSWAQVDTTLRRVTTGRLHMVGCARPGGWGTPRWLRGDFRTVDVSADSDGELLDRHRCTVKGLVKLMRSYDSHELVPPLEDLVCPVCHLPVGRKRAQCQGGHSEWSSDDSEDVSGQIGSEQDTNIDEQVFQHLELHVLGDAVVGDESAAGGGAPVARRALAA